MQNQDEGTYGQTPIKGLFLASRQFQYPGRNQVDIQSYALNTAQRHSENDTLCSDILNRLGFRLYLHVQQGLTILTSIPN